MSDWFLMMDISAWFFMIDDWLFMMDISGTFDFGAFASANVGKGVGAFVRQIHPLEKCRVGFRFACLYEQWSSNTIENRHTKAPPQPMKKHRVTKNQ